MYELNFVDSAKVEIVVAKEILGGYNDFPPGWEEITMEDFVAFAGGAFMPVYIDYRQMWLDKMRGPMVAAALYIQRDFTGYAMVPDRRDQTLSYFKFDGFHKMKEIFDGLPVTSDSGWSLDEGSSIPRRGIRDFNRTIVFERPLTVKEELVVQKYLLRDNCPGWTGVSGGKRGENTYTYRTTYDSSD
jgi:hypothetical protein